MHGFQANAHFRKGEGATRRAERPASLDLLPIRPLGFELTPSWHIRRDAPAHAEWLSRCWRRTARAGLRVKTFLRTMSIAAASAAGCAFRRARPISKRWS